LQIFLGFSRFPDNPFEVHRVPLIETIITRLNEQFLIRQCKLQQRQAQKQLFEELYPGVFRIARRYLAGTQDAEDVLSGSFVRIFRNIGRFEYRGEGSLVKWVNTIVIHECLRYLGRYRPVFEEEDLTCLAAESEWDDHLSGWDAEEIRFIIDHMPVGYRTVFNLFAIEGYSHQEISGMLNISEGTSKSQLSKARNYILDKIKRKSYYGTA
jgi:RNA polymerase sigma-70 factor, ECF subfamily